MSTKKSTKKVSYFAIFMGLTFKNGSATFFHKAKLTVIHKCSIKNKNKLLIILTSSFLWVSLVQAARGGFDPDLMIGRVAEQLGGVLEKTIRVG